MPGYLGSGSTNGHYIYVPIPKNASSAHNGMLQGREGWDRIFFHSELTTTPAYVVVRDPVDRWYSGAAQYERRGKHPIGIEGMIEEVKNGGYPVYDEHTFRQSDFIISSLQNVILVKLENATKWVKENLGYTLEKTHGRRQKRSDPILDPILEDFYAEDMALYIDAI